MLYDSEIINSCSNYAKPKMIEYILSLCDKVEFLLESNEIINLKYSFDKDFKVFIDAFINSYYGKSYGMSGTIYQFKLTAEVKQYFIDRCDIVSPINSLINGIYFDNPAFIINNTYIVSSCSHEKMHDINPKYNQQLKTKYLNIIKTDPTYKQLTQKFYSADTSNFNQEYAILLDLPIYIGNLHYYFSDHKLTDCSYHKFTQIANKYFSNELLYHFNHTITFKGLFFENFKAQYLTEIHYLEIIASNSNLPFTRLMLDYS